MRWTQWILLLCLTTALSAMASDNAALVWPAGQENRTILTPSSSLDDEQPDTLLYDNDAPAALIISTGFFARVRFTPQVDFTVISAYMTTIDGNSVNAACSAWVFTSTPAPGGEQGYCIFNAPYPEFDWMDRNFVAPNDSITVPGGQDFWVVFGPIAGGPQNDGNWNPVYDNAATAQRSSFSTTGKFGTYTATNGDWLFRVGGISGGVFTDLSAGDLYNEVDGEAEFNFELGETVLLHQELTNIGTQAATAYVLEFTVTGPDGEVFYTEDYVGQNLAAGATITATTGTFTPDAEGEYTAQCTALADGDDNGDNNVSLVRFFVGGNHRWYRYDDDDGADSYTGFSDGNGWALKFEPGVWPARLTQVRIDLGGPGTADFRLWMNDADGLPTFPTVWESTPEVVQGWNVIDIVPPIDLFEGQGVTFGYLFQTGISMGYDTDPPNCADIPNMDTIAYQLGSDGDQIFFDDGGNLRIQAFFDTSTALAPFPLIETDRDTINFGLVNPAQPPVQQTLTVFNTGGQDPLNVTGITLTPNAIAPGYTIAPSTFSVPAGGSQEVTVTFDPPIVRAWNGLMTINSNAGNIPAYVILLRGEATTAVHENDSPLPNQFALGQNFPNPFNPSTEIQFSLPNEAEVRLTVVNMLGQEVATVVNGRYSAGVYTASFDAANLPSGLYFYRMVAGDFTSVRKMMLMK